jgi:hypothetical protein
MAKVAVAGYVARFADATATPSTYVVVAPDAACVSATLCHAPSKTAGPGVTVTLRTAWLPVSAT